MATGVETAPRDSESCNNSRELVCNVAENETLGNKEGNAQIEMQRGGEEQQSPDDQVNNPVKSYKVCPKRHEIYFFAAPLLVAASSNRLGEVGGGGPYLHSAPTVSLLRESEGSG